MPISAIPDAEEASQQERIELSRRQIDEIMVETGSYTISAPREIITPGNDDFPSLAFDAEDNLWVAFTSTRNDKDSIRARRFAEKSFSREYQISTREGAEFQCKVACEKAGRVWFVWSAWRDGRWQILARPLADGVLGEETILDSIREGCFNPSVLVTAEGDVWVIWERMLGKVSQIALRTFDGRSWSGIRMISEPGVSSYSPCMAQDNNGTIWCAWDAYSDRDYDVYMRGYRAGAWLAVVQVTRHAANDVQPALAADPEGGLWIAWSSNRESTNRWNLPRWIHLWRSDGKNFFYPPQSQAGKDLSKRGENQSWEFPSLVIDHSGRVWIFGRASNCFQAQYLSSEGWSPLMPLGREVWASRGQRIAAAIGKEGDIWVASRGIQGVELQQIRPVQRALEKPKLYAVRKFEKRVALVNVHQERSRHTVEHAGESLNVYFGDLHGLSSHSDAIGEPDEFYTRCRDIYKLDFAALGDHEEFCNNRLCPAEWELNAAVASSFNCEGKFVTFRAYEWTGRPHPGPGHVLVVYPGDEGWLFGRSDRESNTLPKLFGKLKEVGGIAVPLHIGWTGFDVKKHDPEVQPVVEICSCHGAYEYEGNKPIPHRNDNVVKGSFARDILAQGVKVGFCAGSSGHGLLWHRGKCWRAESWRTGYTAVFAPELTRAAVFEAVKKRRCYATSGERIFLDFRINGHMMGEEFEADGELEVSVVACGVHRIWSIEIIRDGETICSEKRRKREVSCELKAPPPEKGTSYFYARIHQSRDEMAWSSPIWVSAKQ